MDKVMFKVEHRFSYGWDDAGWKTSPGLKPWRFATREEAEIEIIKLCASMNISLGADRRANYCDPKDYRVVEA